MQGKERPTLGTSILFGDKTLFEIATDIISGSNRSTRRIAAPEEMRPCPRCLFYDCMCNTEVYENWRAEKGITD